MGEPSEWGTKVKVEEGKNETWHRNGRHQSRNGKMRD
jgi:hypothetical protein